MPAAARIHQFGNALDVLTVEDIDPPDLESKQMLIQMLVAPVNPADINIIEGRYGELPVLPATMGSEGIGCVVKMGKGVVSFGLGDLVLPMSFGTWSEVMTVSAENAIVMSSEIRIAHASMLTVNPASAFAMLTEFTPLNPGDWVVQNAANSVVGRCVIELANILGLKTLNVVRRPELIAELKALGADVVVTEECDLRHETENLCGGARPSLALNAVGGASALNIANALYDGCVHVTYGAMGRQALKIPNSLAIFRGLRFEGFWLRRWWKSKSPKELRDTYHKLAGWIIEGGLHLPIHAEFPLSEVRDAVAEAATESRSGKVILRMA